MNHLKTGDDLYEEIFGLKRKRGEGYEIIVTCVLQHLNSNATVKHNVMLKTPRGRIYQIDVVVVVKDLDGEITQIADAKDYKQSVGREVVAKLCGDMVALKISNGIIATPNGYTKGAVNYTQDVEGEKTIDLYIVREAKDEDHILPSGNSRNKGDTFQPYRHFL